MRRLQTVNLVLSSILLLGLFGCGSYSKQFVETSNQISRLTNPLLSSNFIEWSFKANIQIKGHEMGGILVIKKIKEKDYRIAFLTEFGGKMIDFKLVNNQFELVEAIPQLNNNRIFDLLAHDFAILLNENFEISQTYLYQNEVIFSSVLNQSQLYIYTAENGFFKKIDEARNNTLKTSFLFSSDHINSDIKIYHKKFKILIDLYKL